MLCGDLFRALGGQFVEPVDDLGIAAAIVDEAGLATIAMARALPASHPQ